MAQNRTNILQRNAMLLGTYMGVYWILKFILFPLMLRMPLLSFLFLGLTLGVPFMGYYFVRMYRNQVCGGVIGFLHAWVFTFFMYMFAALITAVAHYVYFRFIDHGFVLDTYEWQVEQLLNSGIKEFSESGEMLQEALESVRRLTPIEITMQMISWNLFCGAVLAVPTALFVKRRHRII